MNTLLSNGFPLRTQQRFSSGLVPVNFREQAPLAGRCVQFVTRALFLTSAVCSSFLCTSAIDSVVECGVAHAQTNGSNRTPIDFNGDGVSELVLISTNRTLVWSQVDSASGASAAPVNLGVVGDHVIMADWFGTGKPQMGVTRIERGSQFIVWRVRDDRGLIQELQFGEAGDTVVAGVDLDGSGAADAVIVKREGRKYTWFIQFDPFKGGATVVSYPFATTAESLFFIDADGTGVKLAAKARTKKGVTIKLLNPITGEIKTYKNLPIEGAKQRYQFSLPLLAPTGKEMVASITTIKKRTVVTVLDPMKRTKKPQKPKTVTIKAVGDTIYGNFLTNPGFEIAVKSANGVIIANPFDGTQIEVVTPAGVLVDELNINRLGAAAKPAPTPRPDPSTPEVPAPTPPEAPTGEPPTGGLAAVCRTVSPISLGEMLVKSEISDHIHGGDPRATGYTVVCARLCPAGRNNVPFYYSDGAQAGSVGYYGTFSGNGRPRLYGAAGGAPQHFVSQIAPEAARRGNGKLYLDMGNGSCKEFNPTGRNGSL